LDDPGEAVVTGVIASLSYWLHERRPGGTASLSECRARLLAILADEVGYEPSQAREIANKILSYASSEAGLLCERGLAQYGFFHLTLEEYLAAYHLTRQPPARRHDMLQAHWEDDRWREVILLAAGQLGVVEPKPYDVSAFLQDLLQMEPTDAANVGREAVLAGRALADIGTRAVNPKTQRWVIDALRQTMQDLDAKTNRPNEPPHISVRTRYAAGETWDELGELPEDLDAWILCPQCADPSPRSELVLNAVKEQASGGDPSASSGQALLATKYPITNTQFARFIEAGGYENFDYWGGKGSEGWQWRVKGKRRYSSVGTDQPEYWNDPRFGKDRRGYPVVGVSWYEAAAYAVWLTETLQATGHRLQIWRHGQLETCDLRPATLVVRLPTEAEWLRLAGGEKEGKRERYPWDAPGSGRVTDDEKDKNAILARANTSESGIGGTSPVAMYPLGESKPFGLWDVAGNVWEWTDSWYDEEQRARVLRGGSWRLNQRLARPSVRSWLYPGFSHWYVGFRLVSPISSGS
jgi:formylglycine-generating enzyme required for sulfatase activity